MNEHLFDEDVHTEHCSLLGCKYGYLKDCSVTNRTRVASYPPNDEQEEYYGSFEEMHGFYKFVWSDEEIRKFYQLLRPLEPHETYFLSMSARNKYLTEKERIQYDLGRSEMFHRQIISENGFERYLRVVHSLEVGLGGYTSRSNVNLPMKCMIVYANVSPMNGKKALKEFTSETLERVFEGSEDKLYNTLPTLLHNCYQKSRSSNPGLLDIDFDVPHREGYPLLLQFLEELDRNGTKRHVVMTKSGFHILLERDTLHFNYTKKLEELNQQTVKLFGKGEIVTNTNGMIPLPGTRQADHLVQFLEV